MKPMVLFTMSANGIFAALIIVAYILGGNHVSNTFVLNLIFYILITSVLTTTLMKIAYAGESSGKYRKAGDTKGCIDHDGACYICL